MTCHILPSLLAADLTRIGEEIEAVLAAGADLLHLDIMDNHYVPNLTFGPALCEAIRKRFKTVPIDVHLMASPIDALIQQVADAGANRISIHPDTTHHLDRSLQLITELGCQAGLVLNPATSLESLLWCAHRLHFILVMTVNPGFGGQTLLSDIIPKIALLHRHYPALPICVDGGITPANIATLRAAGATQFVVGSALFGSQDYDKTIALLKTDGL